MTVSNIEAPTQVGQRTVIDGVEYLCFVVPHWTRVETNFSPVNHVEEEDAGNPVSSTSFDANTKTLTITLTDGTVFSEVIDIPNISSASFNTATDVLTIGVNGANDITVSIPGGTGGGGDSITFQIPATDAEFVDSGFNFSPAFTIQVGTNYNGIGVTGAQASTVLVGGIDTGRVTVEGVEYTFGISAASGGNAINITNPSGTFAVDSTTDIFVGDGGTDAQTVTVTSIVNTQATTIDSDTGALTIAPEVLLSRLRDGYTKVITYNTDGDVTSVAYTATDETSYTGTFGYNNSGDLMTVTYTETDTGTTVMTKTLTYNAAGDVTNVTLT